MPSNKLGMLGAAGQGGGGAYDLYCWGHNENGSNLAWAINGAGHPSGYTSSPVMVGSDKWKDVTGIGRGFIGIKEDGTMWFSGKSCFGADGLDRSNFNPMSGYSKDEYETNQYNMQQIGTDTDWATVHGTTGQGNYGGNVCGAFKEDGSFYNWGCNLHGILGNGGDENNGGHVGTPTLHSAAGTWSNIAISQVTLAVKPNGTLWAWGMSYQGVPFGGYESSGNYPQQPAGTTRGKLSSPVQVGSRTDWHQVQNIQEAGWAQRTNGHWYAWGANRTGTGIAGTAAYSEDNIVQNGPWDLNTQMGLGQQGRSLAKSDGSLYTWGYNLYGAVGQGNSSTHLDTPVQCGNLTDWKASSDSGGNQNSPISDPTIPMGGLRGGGALSGWIKSDGTLWTWGHNLRGSVGNGQSTQNNGNATGYDHISSPVQIGSESWFKIAATGGDHSATVYGLR